MAVLPVTVLEHADAQAAVLGHGEGRLRMLTRVIDQLVDGVAVIDDDGWFVLVNPSFAAMHGCAAGDSLLGSHFTVFYSPRDQSSRVEELIAATLRDGIGRAEVVRRRRDGTRFPAHVTMSLLHDDDGELVGRVMTIQDLSAAARPGAR